MQNGCFSPHFYMIRMWYPLCSESDSKWSWSFTIVNLHSRKWNFWAGRFDKYNCYCSIMFVSTSTTVNEQGIQSDEMKVTSPQKIMLGKMTIKITNRLCHKIQQKLIWSVSKNNDVISYNNKTNITIYIFIY